MRTFFNDLAQLVEDIADEVHVDVSAMDAAVKARIGRVSAKQRDGLLRLRDAAEDLDELVARLIGPATKSAPAIKSAPTFDRSVVSGTEVKAMGDSGWVCGYGLRFGTEQDDGDLSQHRDIFAAPPKGYYGRTANLKNVPVLVHHGMLPDYGIQELTNPAQMEIDRVGLFVKHLLDLREPYEKALYALVKRGKMGFSTGALSHLVERKSLSGGRNMITKWYLGELSYTPAPASGGGTDASAMKALLDEFGIKGAESFEERRMPQTMQPAGPSGTFLVPFDAAEARKVRAPTQWRAPSDRAALLMAKLDELEGRR